MPRKTAVTPETVTPEPATAAVTPEPEAEASTTENDAALIDWRKIPDLRFTDEQGNVYQLDRDHKGIYTLRRIG